MAATGSGARTPEHPNLTVIRRYYEGCSTANVPLMLWALTRDAVHYFVEEPPVRGARRSRRSGWSSLPTGVRPRGRSTWGLAAGEDAVIEWTMLYRPRPGEALRVFRRAEWYVFRDGLISEIRAYELVGGEHPAEFDGYPYAGRGYPMPGPGADTHTL